MIKLNEKTKWYTSKHKPFDLPSDGKPVAYFLDKDQAYNHAVKLWHHLAEIEQVEDPSHLEFIVSKENGPIVASFKFGSHALKYLAETLRGKGEITPNPQD